VELYIIRNTRYQKCVYYVSGETSILTHSIFVRQ